jgi:hypothetical protein
MMGLREGKSMKTKNRITLTIFLALSFLAGCAQTESDVQLTRRIFNGLCNGRQAVEKLIDWEGLKAVETDVGQAYTTLKNEKEKADYRKVFFYNFSYAFKAAGGKASLFYNWRVKTLEPDKTVVAAETSGRSKVILFTLTRKGKERKLTDIEWEK